MRTRKAACIGMAIVAGFAAGPAADAWAQSEAQAESAAYLQALPNEADEDTAPPSDSTEARETRQNGPFAQTADAAARMAACAAAGAVAALAAGALAHRRTKEAGSRK